jgi:hypothetical protein
MGVESFHREEKRLTLTGIIGKRTGLAKEETVQTGTEKLRGLQVPGAIRCKLFDMRVAEAVHEFRHPNDTAPQGTQFPDTGTMRRRCGHVTPAVCIIRGQLGSVDQCPTTMASYPPA